MDIGLSGKTVVVTGAAMGIGGEICAGFASNDASVIGVDVVDMSKTAKYKDSLGKGELLNQVSIDLASPLADAVTGQLCPVDRGLIKY